VLRACILHWPVRRPFILVAALTGTLYVLTPQIESHLYAASSITSRGGPGRWPNR
jgi:uncharacterized iron-regulated membrane protein